MKQHASSRLLLSSLLSLVLLAPPFARAAGGATADGAQAVTVNDDFRRGLDLWKVEQMPGGTVEAAEGVLAINDKEGCTVWLRRKLKAPLTIRYKAKLVSQGGTYDRVSDLNCFWMATDPKCPDDIFASKPARDGKFASYDGLRTYYVGCGGNTNTSTRFRRYSGTGERPLLPEHDLSAPKYLLEANREYQIEIRSDGEWIEYRRDGEVFFRWRDPQPLKEGWFGFRTVWSHTEIRDFSAVEGQ